MTLYIYFLPTYQYIQDVMEEGAQVPQAKLEVNHLCLIVFLGFLQPTS